MVYPFCTKCQARAYSEKELQEMSPKVPEAQCSAPSSHRAQELMKYRADFRLGGRRGKRYRPLFDTAQKAEEFEEDTCSDYRRGKFVPGQSKILFKDLAAKYYNDHCLQKGQHAQRTSYYWIELLKKELGNRLAESITKQDVRDLQVKLKKDRSGATVNRIIGGVLRPIFNKGIEWELIGKNPCTKPEKLEEDEPIPRFLNQEELDRLYKELKDPRLQDFADMILHTGARPISLERCNFDTGDVDFQNRVIWFTTYKGQKNKKHRYPHPMDSTVYGIVLRRMAETGGKGPVFDFSNHRKLAEAAIKESKINEGKPENQHFTIYGLKHCYASRLLMSGVSMFDVAKLLGHTDTKMLLKHYGKLTMEYLRQQQAKATLPSADRSSNEVAPYGIRTRDLPLERRIS